VFISYLTVQPERDNLDDYIQKMSEELEDEQTELWYLGRLVEFIDRENLSDKVSVFNSISELVTKI
jgi:hypothetical protein